MKTIWKFLQAARFLWSTEPYDVRGMWLQLTLGTAFAVSAFCEYILKPSPALGLALLPVMVAGVVLVALGLAKMIGEWLLHGERFFVRPLLWPLALKSALLIASIVWLVRTPTDWQRTVAVFLVCVLTGVVLNSLWRINKELG